MPTEDRVLGALQLELRAVVNFPVWELNSGHLQEQLGVLFCCFLFVFVF